MGCPIADFARENGYGELMPYFCEADGAVMEALRGTLHRDHTVAELRGVRLLDQEQGRLKPGLAQEVFAAQVEKIEKA